MLSWVESSTLLILEPEYSIGPLEQFVSGDVLDDGDKILLLELKEKGKNIIIIYKKTKFYLNTINFHKSCKVNIKYLLTIFCKLSFIMVISKIIVDIKKLTTYSFNCYKFNYYYEYY